MKRTAIIVTILILLIPILCVGQQKVMYKQVDTTKLFIEVHYPAKMEKDKQYPGMVFYFGGGWKTGNRQHFIHHANYFIKRGVVCFLVDYRVELRNKTSPFEALMDAKSAMRYVRKHAADFQVDPSKIIASGGSAGGHLAAATATVSEYNDPSDDLLVSCVPNALVLYNPVIDNGPGGYGYERVGEAYKNFSPLHNIKKGTPPTIIFLGTKDHLIPVETVEYFKVVMKKVKSRCETKIYEGGKHGFFNYNKNNLAFFKNTIAETDVFLQSLGYIAKKPVVEIE